MSEQMSPSEKLRQGTAIMDPVLMENALDAGANPYERAMTGPYTGLSALEMMARHPNATSFAPEMWKQVSRSFDALPQTREDTAVLQSAVLGASTSDAYATTLAHSQQDMLPVAQSRRQMLSVVEGSASWVNFKAMMSFPHDFSHRQSQAQQEGRLDAELSILNVASASANEDTSSLRKNWAPTPKPSFAVGKDNNHQQEVNRAPSVSSTTYLQPSEQAFINQLDDGTFEDKFPNHFDNDQDEADVVGDYHDTVPRLSSSYIKTHKCRRFGQPIKDPNHQNTSSL